MNSQVMHKKPVKSGYTDISRKFKKSKANISNDALKYGRVAIPHHMRIITSANSGVINKW
jgi:hypothetical protein